MSMKMKKRSGRFIGIPYRVASSGPFAKLGAPENKLILDLLLQYNGTNNGMMSPCIALMKERGWAKSSLHRAFTNLQHTGFLSITRQGWKQRGKPTLVAFTWIGIDEPKKDIEYDDEVVPSHSPLSYWCKAKSCWKNQPKAKQISKAKKTKDALQIGGVKARYSPYLELVAS